MADLFDTLISLSKRRGFLFQSSEIYGGLSAAYDYGPLGVELKRKVSDRWWRASDCQSHRVCSPILQKGLGLRLQSDWNAGLFRYMRPRAVRQAGQATCHRPKAMRDGGS